MDVETVFYSLGIVFMVLCIVILLGIAILVFFIGKKVVKMQKLVEDKINEVADLTVKPIRKATDMAQNLLTGTNRGSKKKH